MYSNDSFYEFNNNAFDYRNNNYFQNNLNISSYFYQNPNYDNYSNIIPLNEIEKKITNQQPDYYLRKSINDIDYFYEQKTNPTLYQNLCSKMLLKKDEIENENFPIFYSFEDIEKIIKNDENKKKFNNKVRNFIDINCIEKAEKEIHLTGQKRIREENDNLYILINNDEEKRLKRGRKPKGNNNNEIHDKMSSDNITKKIKAKLFLYALYFLNNISNRANENNKNKLMKLDYKFINRLNRKIDLKYLDTSLKDLFSMDISIKYKKMSIISKNYNRITIEKILNEEDDTILFAFNMTFRDWLDLFTFKKSVADIMNLYDLSYYKNIDSERIEKSMVGIDQLLNKMVDKIDEDYFSYFIFHLYNYERWFFIKKGRKLKKNNKE